MPEKELTPSLTESQTIDSDTPLILCEPLEISTDNLGEKLEFNEDEFQKGLKEVSYYCGMYTGLINAGVPVDDATGFLFNHMSMTMNIKISEITANASIESSKNTSIKIDNQSL